MSEDSQQNAEVRFLEFLTQVRAGGPLWGLRNEVGLATWRYEEGEDAVVPFFSGEGAARLCGEENFSGYRPFRIPARDFLDSYLPALGKQSLGVSINPTPLMTGIDMPADALAQKIGEEG
jgi:hypothetical protein